MPVSHNQKQISSSSYFTKAGLIRIVEYNNPEVYFVPQIVDYFKNQIGQSSLLPNFTALRVGSVHPFALALFAQELGNKISADLFPSITVADTEDSEDPIMMGRDYDEVTLDVNAVSLIAASAQKGSLIISPANLTALQAAVQAAAGQTLVGRRAGYWAAHQVNMNIWGENRDVVVLIYDLLKHFIISNIQMFHEAGIDVQKGITGRRTGDINLDFSMLLYGANITVPCTIQTASMLVEVPYGYITSIDSAPTFFTTEQTGK